MCTVLHILACGKSGGIETLVSEYARESSHDNHFVFVWEDGYYGNIFLLSVFSQKYSKESVLILSH